MTDRLKPSYVTHIHIPEEFNETLRLFLAMMGADKTFMTTIKKENKNKGIASPAIRYVIQKYVDRNREAFMSKHPQARTSARAPVIETPVQAVPAEQEVSSNAET